MRLKLVLAAVAGACRVQAAAVSHHLSSLTRGDDVWHNRWIQVVYNKPEYVEIISWNDYGESHHIAPVYSHALEAFEVGKAPYNYANNRPHDGWRLTLPFLIDYYKTGKATVTQEGLVACSENCVNGLTNWNPWVGSSLVPGSAPATTPRSRSEQGCTKGTGAKGFTELCESNCKYDYCPVSSCVCTAVGIPNKKPTALQKDGFPTKGRSENYSGLCSSACNLGYCPEEYSPTQQPTIVPTVSEFLPPACRAGKGRAGHEGLTGLCSYACNFGFCPTHLCECTDQGGLIQPPGQVAGKTGKAIGDINDDKLCAFACSRTWCPSDVCEAVDEGKDDDDDDEEPVDPSEACSDKDRTYFNGEMDRVGEYMRWFLMEPEYAATTGKQYITIVNLTPHPFKLTYTHSYQMDEFNWGDIPSGRARQNVAHYTEHAGANPQDNNGEAYYDIGDTGKKFVVRVTTHIPDTYPRRIVFDLSGMGKGQREYRVPEQEVPVTLVITGSDFFGFITSLSHGPGNWMNLIKEDIKHRRLFDVIMPGTHDSGMSKITEAILTGATSANTQTQGLKIYDQLRVGARYDEMADHLSDEMADVPIGKSGEKFDDVVSEINKFTSENPGEVIALQFRYLVGVRDVPSKGPVYWDETIKNKFFDKLMKIENRCGKLESGRIQDYTMDRLMSSNNGKGCVLIFMNTFYMEKHPGG
ncbi:hypothetical protein LZ31DRAFT_540891 [Colletotrichum somersetense]|nr:hypothetical protein LZ31DRAFT_540891 [Colletotrichum somersetense]